MAELQAQDLRVQAVTVSAAEMAKGISSDLDMNDMTVRSLEEDGGNGVAMTTGSPNMSSEMSFALLNTVNVVTGSTDILASAVRMLRLSDEGLTWLLPSFLGQWQIHFGYVYITRPYNIFLYLFIMLSPINISLNVFLLVAFLFASVEIASKPLNKIICTYRKIRWVTVGPLQWYCWTPIEYDTLPKFNVAPEKLPSQ